MTPDIIDMIDAATGCQQCEGPLRDSVSDDFCSDGCQTMWHSERADPLTDYREPDDLPVHVFNQVELYNPETSPRREGLGITIMPGLNGFAQSAAAVVANAGEAFRAFGQSISGMRSYGFVLDETHMWPDLDADTPIGTWNIPPISFEIGMDSISPDAFRLLFPGDREPRPVLPVAEQMRTALEARRHRNTGPSQRGRAPRRIDPRRSR